MTGRIGLVLALVLFCGAAVAGEEAEAPAEEGYVTLEDLDQRTVHNVLRRAERPEAADLVWEMIEKGNIGTPVEVPMAPEVPPHGNVMLMRGHGPQVPSGE